MGKSSIYSLNGAFVLLLLVANLIFHNVFPIFIDIRY